MSVPLTAAIEDVHAKRWGEWQVHNAAGQRQGARRARLVFTVIFIVLGIWFGLQLVS
jgi:hypothetical protein